MEVLQSDGRISVRGIAEKCIETKDEQQILYGPFANKEDSRRNGKKCQQMSWRKLGFGFLMRPDLIRVIPIKWTPKGILTPFWDVGWSENLLDLLWVPQEDSVSKLPGGL